ncbi:Hypothetical predicted protein [Octopus vulgaris]|uniref:Uncharacterized protein n=1 Tax=Octopus vulgaris TaxID=6645 RepID=A0AA36ANJ1_OCTVU|nr:Hypothetical predicted protein [Octopus vulgaris]
MPEDFVTEKNEMLLAMLFMNSPKKSTRRASHELSIPRTSLQRLMPKLKLKPFRPRLVHGLFEYDQDHRLRFCEMMRDQIGNEEADYLAKIILPDEA